MFRRYLFSGGKSDMAVLKIKSMWLDDARCDERGNGIVLNVYLNNETTIGFLLDSKASEPLFRDVVLGKCGEPETDGARVFWSNGASLSIRDMMEIMQSEKKTGTGT